MYNVVLHGVINASHCVMQCDKISHCVTHFNAKKQILITNCF